TKPGLMPPNPASIDGARPDHDVGRIALCDVVQPLKLVNGSREIRVREENVGPGRVQHARPDAVSLAPVLSMMDEPYALRFETPDDLGSSVGRAVVDHQDLERKSRSSQDFTHFTQRVRDSPRFIECRDDDRDARRKGLAGAHPGRPYGQRGN